MKLCLKYYSFVFFWTRCIHIYCTFTAHRAEGIGACDGQLCFQEYDFIFDVELDKDRPPLKLPYNVGDDPQSAARNFLQQNDVDERFLETVADYIRSRAVSHDSVPPNTTVSDSSTGKPIIKVTVNTYLDVLTFSAFIIHCCMLLVGLQECCPNCMNSYCSNSKS